MRPPRRCGTGSQVGRRPRNARPHRHAPNLYRNRKSNKQARHETCPEPTPPRTRLVYWRGSILLLTGFAAHVLLSCTCLRRVLHAPVTRMTTTPVADAIGCDAVCAQSYAACDGEIAEREFAAIDAHLQRCAECRARFLGDAVFLRALRAAGRLERAPASLRERIVHVLHQHATENAAT